ncbi:MAG: hypothetical protein OEY49_18265 [Candidatus Heimdallarchaeota archaeon]|nr:hypothetical protein [Candidatus Heimdallarchaeota archaeon]
MNFNNFFSPDVESGIEFDPGIYEHKLAKWNAFDNITPDSNLDFMCLIPLYLGVISNGLTR